MVARVDPVAIDQACADAGRAQPVIGGSLLDGRMRAPGFVDRGDIFTNTTPESEWKSCLEHAEKIGLGSRSYELIRV